MSDNWLERTTLLLTQEKLNDLKNANVLIVGLGGVGSFAAEFVVRSGIGNLTIVDGDTIDTTNRNRQLPALISTIGKSKVEVVGNRLKDINAELNLTKINEFLTSGRMKEVVLSQEYDYIMDCIDSVSPKVDLIEIAKRHKIKIVSSMGAGGKMDPSQVKIRDLSKTKDCPLAKNIRKRLKKRKVDKGVRCVFSTELVREESLCLTDGSNFKQSYYGTNSYMPALFGLYAASEVIRKLSKS
ncbi:E1 ubiquitin-activating enzyme [Flavobacteriaceae bacterium UJ101]|nr:E1 ubiquitin-activating enzyme [Flavobacteriaceae bacterium UJ101]